MIYQCWWLRIINTILIKLSLVLLTLVVQNKNIWYQIERAAAHFSQQEKWMTTNTEKYQYNLYFCSTNDA